MFSSKRKQQLHDMCAGSWIKTKGACRYSDGSFNAFTSSKATPLDACKEFCVKNSKCAHGKRMVLELGLHYVFSVW